MRALIFATCIAIMVIVDADISPPLQALATQIQSVEPPADSNTIIQPLSCTLCADTNYGYRLVNSGYFMGPNQNNPWRGAVTFVTGPNTPCRCASALKLGQSNAVQVKFFVIVF